MREVARLLLPPVRWDPLRGLGAVWPTVERALDAGVGGFVLDGAPTDGAVDLTRRIRDRADETPLLIVDPARLAEYRLGEAGFSLPPLGALASLRDTHTLRRAARATARAVRRIGGNAMLAPSGDVCGSPRIDTFGADPSTVALSVAEWIDAAQAEGVLCCVGSFPGGGRVTGAERAIPVLRAAEDSLYETDLVPFRAAIDAGVSAISMAAAAYPALDRTGTPAPLSVRIVGSVLRRELGFDGLVIADGEELEARTGRRVPVSDLVAAGVDLVARSARLDVELRALLDAVEQGRLHGERVHEAVSRRRVRAELAGAPLLFSTARDADDAAWLDEVTERTIAVIRGRAVHIGAPIELVVVGERAVDPASTIAAFAGGVAEGGGDASSVRHAVAPFAATRSAMVVVATPTGDLAALEAGGGPATALASVCAHARRSRRDVAVIWCGHPETAPTAVDADLLIACWCPSSTMLRACGRWLLRRV
jgi:beta-glucosidase-like glycosyl hydrolase